MRFFLTFLYFILFFNLISYVSKPREYFVLCTALTNFFEFVLLFIYFSYLFLTWSWHISRNFCHYILKMVSGSSFLFGFHLIFVRFFPLSGISYKTKVVLLLVINKCYLSTRLIINKCTNYKTKLSPKCQNTYF